MSRNNGALYSCLLFFLSLRSCLLPPIENPVRSKVPAHWVRSSSVCASLLFFSVLFILEGHLMSPFANHSLLNRCSTKRKFLWKRNRKKGVPYCTFNYGNLWNRFKVCAVCSMLGSSHRATGNLMRYSLWEDVPDCPQPKEYSLCICF